MVSIEEKFIYIIIIKLELDIYVDINIKLNN